MDVCYSDENLIVESNSIFLAGPTPRSATVTSWRIEALEILKSLNYAGQVLVPERKDWSVKFDYTDQVEWEFKGLEECAIIAFWVPRNLDTMPAFTTNVEFGKHVDSGRAIYGRPDSAANIRYLDWLYTKMTGKIPNNTLYDLLAVSVQCVNN